MLGNKLSQETLDKVKELSSNYVTAEDDFHATNSYRKHLLSNLLNEALLEAKDDCFEINMDDIKPLAQTKKISVNINGRNVEKDVNVRMLLSDFIRHELNLKGTMLVGNMEYGSMYCYCRW